MAKHFDSAGKRFIDADPLAWLRFFGLKGQAARVLDSDLTTSLTADRVLEVSDPDYLAHFEILSSSEPGDIHRYMAYCVAIGFKHQLPVETLLIMLRRAADGPAFTGEFIFNNISFRYHVVRIWEIPSDQFLLGPLSMLPLAPLSRVRGGSLPTLIRDMQERVTLEATPSVQKDLWTMTNLVLGMIMSRTQSDVLLKGVFHMLDLRVSDTYQAILEEGEAIGEAKGKAEGRAEGLREALLRTGTRRFGAPSESSVAAIQAITSIDELDRLIDRLLDVETWADLLS